MLLELREVSFSYDGGPGGMLLDSLDLSVRNSDFIIIRGASGSGKSTILRLICRLQTPVSGMILFRGEPVSAFNPSVLRSSICYVPQIPVMVEGSVSDNLMLPFSFEVNTAKPKPSVKELELMLEKFYLGDVPLSQTAQKLSVGQKQRLALMRAILQEPDILLLDEPTSALDRDSAAMVFTIIERLNTIEGKTVITVTHSDYSPSVEHPKYYILRNQKLMPE
jgi:putative ABC transport system ATP-binding protein